MEVVKKYIQNHIEVPLNLELFKSLLSDDFNGVLIENKKDIQVLRKKEFTDFFQKRQFSMIQPAVILSKQIVQQSDNVFTVYIDSIQAKNVGSQIPPNLVTFKVKDQQTYKVVDGSLSFVMHQWDVELHNPKSFNSL